MKIEIKILDLGVALELLDYLRAYTNACKFKIANDKAELFCKNAVAFPNTCFRLTSNVFSLNVEDKEFMMCFKDVTTFRNALSIINDVSDKKKCLILEADCVVDDNGAYVANSISYSHDDNQFEIQCALPIVVEDYISKGLKDTPTTDFIFTVDPAKLRLMQSKATVVVDVANVSPYFIYSKEKNNVVLALKNTGRKDTAKYNSIALPISDKCSGEIKNKTLEANGIAISMQAFSIFNILKQNDSLNCFFCNKWNTFGVFSKKTYENDIVITSQLYIIAVNGK